MLLMLQGANAGFWLVTVRPRLTKRHRQRCDNFVMTIETVLKTMELLENRLQPDSGVTPLFSMRTVSLALSQSCSSIDADAWCKRALKVVFLF